MTEQYKKCDTCSHLIALKDYSKETILSGAIYIRKTCKRCRNKKRREKYKETDYGVKIYWSMSKEKREEYIKKKSKYNSLRANAKEIRKEYNNSDRGIYNRYKNDCNRRGRLRREIKMLITFENFKTLINLECHYCGDENCRGVDRVDSNKSYTTKNSIPCCKICNIMKNNLNIKQFYDHIRKIEKKTKK